MGRRDRERSARIEAGQEQPFRGGKGGIAGVVARKTISLFSRRGVREELLRGTVAEQTGKLSELHDKGVLPGGNLKAAIMRKAPEEMDKAIKKYRKQGKEITVDSLLTEVRSEPGFLAMCERVGLSYGWFEELAKKRMETYGLS